MSSASIKSDVTCCYRRKLFQAFICHVKTSFTITPKKSFCRTKSSLIFDYVNFSTVIESFHLFFVINIVLKNNFPIAQLLIVSTHKKHRIYFNNKQCRENAIFPVRNLLLIIIKTYYFAFFHISPTFQRKVCSQFVKNEMLPQSFLKQSLRIVLSLELINAQKNEKNIRERGKQLVKVQWFKLFPNPVRWTKNVSS